MEVICWPYSAHRDAEREKMQRFHLCLQWRHISSADRAFGDHNLAQWCGKRGIPDRHAALLTGQLHARLGGYWKSARGFTTYLLPFTCSKRAQRYFRFTFLCSMCSSRPQEIALFKSRAMRGSIFFSLFFFSQRKLEVKNERSKSG